MLDVALIRRCRSRRRPIIRGVARAAGVAAGREDGSTVAGPRPQLGSLSAGARRAGGRSDPADLRQVRALGETAYRRPTRVSPGVDPEPTRHCGSGRRRLSAAGRRHGRMWPPRPAGGPPYSLARWSTRPRRLRSPARRAHCMTPPTCSLQAHLAAAGGAPGVLVRAVDPSTRRASSD